MNYTQALAYIHSLDRFGSRPGLDRIRRLFDNIPEALDQRFIHIAGTNGKGSVSTMLSRILQAAGYKVGLFLSPGKAAASAGVGFAAMVVLCALAGSGSVMGFDPARLWVTTPLQVGVATRLLLTDAATWLTGAGWVGAAAALAALAHDGGPGRCYAGCGVAFAITCASALLASHVENEGSSWGLAPGVLAGVIGSTILGILVLFLLGTPRALRVDAGTDGSADDNAHDAQK